MDLHYQSPWFTEALEKEEDLIVNELNLNLNCDVCIIGGGYTGLWTAIKIKEKKPQLNIILIEKDLCGSGASGRNGGCMIPQSTKFQGIRDVVGIDDAKKMVLSTEAAVKHIKDFCSENKINAEIPEWYVSMPTSSETIMYARGSAISADLDNSEQRAVENALIKLSTQMKNRISSKTNLVIKEAGVDAVVAEGFEAGGHNGHEEITTMCLIPQIKSLIDVPLIAAGGIGSGAAMLAAMSLGADGVQIGSVFAASKESSAHINFKNKILLANDGDTKLTLKEIVPVRLLKNDFYYEIENAYKQNASKEDLINILSRGRAKKGMFEGDISNGELEIGQISATIDSIKSVKKIITTIINDFNFEKNRLLQFNL